MSPQIFSFPLLSGHAEDPPANDPEPESAKAMTWRDEAGSASLAEQLPRAGSPVAMRFRCASRNDPMTRVIGSPTPVSQRFHGTRDLEPIVQGTGPTAISL
ncbi:hypothetical protein JL100_006730 [Skermanella mucosa]|uniref:hypothetical protein n=1 Tax=Skermanella mucosa TaxID=1789672 RepID=UPI00192B8E09|nr:hypothetical protein [Skermanella mucosa]UEM22435.1 hypothetical protein JL100_006730 [Skermanella mucosa]